MELRWRVSAWWTFIWAGSKESMVYRANYLFNLVGVFIQVYVLSAVWTAVYADRTSVDGVDLPTMVTYVTLISVQTWLLVSASVSRLPDRVRDGQVAFDIARPLGLFGQVLPRQLGLGATQVPFALVALPVAGLIGELQAPASLAAGLTYLASLALAYVIATVAATVLGMIAFWTFEVRGIVFIYRTIQTFFAGALVPLWLMPEWLRILAEALPFQAIAYTPVSIYLGRLDGADVYRALGVQVFWVVTLSALTYLVWRRAVRKVVIQGG